MNYRRSKRSTARCEPLAATVSRPFNFHQVTCESPDFAAFHFKDIAEHERQGRSVFASRHDRAFCNDNVVLLDEPNYLYDGVACESGIHDVVIERSYASGHELARDIPFDVVCNARQNRFPVRGPESLYVLLYDEFVFSHVQFLSLFARALNRTLQHRDHVSRLSRAPSRIEHGNELPPLCYRGC